MGTKLGTYDHLEKSNPFSLEFSVQELVEMIENTNYGTHRFLSELVRYRKAMYEERGWDKDPLGEIIREALDRGLF